MVPRHLPRRPWWEAAAYCAWKGRRLPTVFEWEKAARDGRVAEGGVVMPWGMVASAEHTAGRANFGLRSTTPVDAHPFGISPWGVYDLAGNVREWLTNPMGSGYAVTGGSWDGPSYLHTEVASVPASQASPSLGFRCARSAGRAGPVLGTTGGAMRLPEALEAPVYDPVDRAEFQRLLAQYRYDPQPADPRGTERVETEHWTRERVWIDGPADDSILVYVYTPRAGYPPHQAVVFVPGTDAFCCATVAEATEVLVGPLIQAGRAVISVVLDEQKKFFDQGPEALKPLPMTSVAERLGIHVATVSRAVRRLESLRHVRRTRHPGDGRSFVLELTAKGRRLFESILPSADERYREILSGLTASEKRSLAKALTKLIEHTEGLERTGS